MPGVLRHTVTVSISKTTAAITIREILGIVGALDVTQPMIGPLALARRSFGLVKIGIEQNGTTGDEAFCILLSLQPHTLSNSSIDFTIPRNGRLPSQNLISRTSLDLSHQSAASRYASQSLGVTMT